MKNFISDKAYCPESRYKSAKLNFKAAQVNVLASADQHGYIEKVHDLDRTIQNNFDKIFPNSNGPGVANVFTVVGDWFVEPGADDFKTINCPEIMGQKGGKARTFSVGEYQLLFLNKIVDKIGQLLNIKQDNVYTRPAGENDIDFEIANKNSDISQNRGEVTNAKYKALLGIGNHCLESKDSYLLDLLKGTSKDVTKLLTNANFENEKAELLKKHEDIKEYSILEVEDDKNPNLKHKVLFLSFTPHRLGFFCPDVAKDLNVLDYTDELQMDAKAKETLQETFKKTFTLIEAFKKKNHNGAVVLLNHVGNPLSAEFVKRMAKYRETLEGKDKDKVKIDLILNAHDHKDWYKVLNSEGKDLREIYKDGNIPENEESVPVISLGQDVSFFRGVKLEFDDNGKLKVLYDHDKDNFKCKPEDKPEDKPLQGENLFKLFEYVLRSDRKKDIHIVVDGDYGDDGKAKRTVLGYKDVRWNAEPIVNPITDGIFDSIKQINKNIELFGMSGASIRGALPVNDNWASRFDLFNIMCANTTDSLSVYTTKMSGLDMVKFIAENISHDMENPGRNDLVQWSGIWIDRDELWKLTEQPANKYTISSKIDETKAQEYLPFIKIKDIKTGKYENLILNKEYNVALQKHLAHIFPLIKGYSKQKDSEQKDRLTPLVPGKNPTIRDLYYDYLGRNGNKITIPNPDDDKRIKTSKLEPVELVKKH